MRTSCLLLISIFLLMQENVFSQSEKFGQMFYTTPAGWNVAKFTDGVALLPAELPANEKLFIQILQAMNFSGTMEQALEKSYDEACTILQANKMREVNGGNYTALPAKNRSEDGNISDARAV
jgi:hypothetical protein